MILTKKQTKALDYLEDSQTTEVYYGGAAGGGKSVLGCFWLIRQCLKYEGTRWLMGRSELKNLKKTTLNSFFEVAKEQGLTANVHFRLNHQDNIITFPNGSQILMADLYAYPSDPEFDSLGSLEITGAFIDEASQVTEKAKNIVKSRIRFRLNEFKVLPKVLMSGNPSKGWAYNEFYKPFKEGKLRPDRKFVQALPGDNKHLPQSYIESLRGLDKNSRERLLEGNWEYDDDPATLIDYEKILDVFSNDFVSGGTKRITCDVARFGSDRTVVGLWDGDRCRMVAYKHKSVSETADLLRRFQAEHKIAKSEVIADEDGVGGGVVDILGCLGFVNNSRPLPNPITRGDENYQNLKSQCYFMLADKINKGQLYIECSDIQMRSDIIQELEQVKQWNMDKDGKRAVMPKDKVKEIIGRSPDYADTLMMRMYFELETKRSWAIV